MINKTKGFTIIELLVVVAIIAVLAAIVLVNVTGYINSSKNAAIRGNLSTVLTNGSVYYDTNGSYTSFCSNAYYTTPAAAITNAGGAASCNVNVAGTAWCACSTTKVTSSTPAGTTICVDSTGKKTDTMTACATECGSSGACI